MTHKIKKLLFMLEGRNSLCSGLTYRTNVCIIARTGGWTVERVIYHIDVNSAFLSWEACYRIHHKGGKKDLREQVAVVGGDVTQRHGIVLAKSIPSKKYGIQTGESLMEARKKCPDLIVVPPNYNLYERCSKAFIRILQEYTPDVEQYSIDEAFLDMTGTQALFGAPLKVAHAIRERIRDELGFTVNVGVSSNKLLAKMASDFSKPDRVHTLYPDEIEKKMWPLPVSDLFFVGNATKNKLVTLGINTIGDLAKSDLQWLKFALKKHGEVIWNFANGIDFSPVITVPVPNKGYGNSTTTPFDVMDAATAKIVLLALAETVGTRLRKDDVKISVVSLGIRFSDLSYCSHQRVITIPTNITNEIHKVAGELFDELWNGVPIRHLGIHTSKVCDNDGIRQLSLFEEISYEKLIVMDKTVDKIRAMYGNDSIKRAVFVKHDIDHMSGGISREKREVDYSKIRID